MMLESRSALQTRTSCSWRGKLKMNDTQLLAIMAAILAARGNKSKQLENAVEDAARLWEIVEKKVANKTT